MGTFAPVRARFLPSHRKSLENNGLLARLVDIGVKEIRKSSVRDISPEKGRPREPKMSIFQGIKLRALSALSKG